jgi:KRAB domain-containing zinc finger protein
MESSFSSLDIVEHALKRLLRNVMKRMKKTLCCRNCPRIFYKRVKLEAHVLSEHTLFKCDVCEEVCNTIITLKKHGRLHTKKYNKALKAQIYHLEKKASKVIINPVFCDEGQCEFKANNMPTLKLHKIFIHSIRKFKSNKDVEIIGKSIHCDEDQCVYKTKSTITIRRATHAIRTHKLNKHFRGTFRMCDQCDFKAKEKAQLKEHKIGVHDGVLFFCDACDYRGNKQKLLDSHKRRIHKVILQENNTESNEYEKNHKLKKNLKCDKCYKSYTTKQGLNLHTRSHHQGLECEICNESFTRPSDLDKHNQLDHNVAKPDTSVKHCEICNKHFTQRSVLFRHKRTEHQGIKFRCTKCPFETKRKEYLQKHSQCNPDWTLYKGKQTKCGQCPYIGPSDRDVREHVKLKHTQKNIFCLHCPRTFNKVIQLKTHVKSNHTLFRCDVCEVEFQFMRTLKKHGQVHKGNIKKEDQVLKTQKKNFEKQATRKRKIRVKVEGMSLHCDEGQCEYKTTPNGGLSALRMHKLRIHCRGIFKICDQCDFKTAETARLKEHILAVHEGVVFVCDVCDYKANKLRLLQDHTNRNHLKQKY